MVASQATYHWNGSEEGAITLEGVTVKFGMASLTYIIGSIVGGKSALYYDNVIYACGLDIEPD